MLPTLPYTVEIVLKGNLSNFKVKFLDNEFSNMVFSKFKNYIDIKDGFRSNNFNYPFGGLPWDQLSVDAFTLYCRDAISKINSLSTVKFPIDPQDIEFKEKSWDSRNLLNRLHRYFTYVQMSQFTSWSNSEHIVSSPRIPKAGQTKELHKTVDKINDVVHRLQVYYYNSDFSDRITTSPIFHEFNIEFDSQRNYLENIDEKYYKNRVSTPQGFDVWLPICYMRGKNLFDCYFDHDDPGLPDIENENTFNGTIALGTREGFLNDKIADWLYEHNVPLSVGIPLGYIVEGKQSLQGTYPDCVEEIKIYND